MGYPTSGVRWRDDTGWELRCPSCAKDGSTACYWPLTDEFWDRRQMTHCRACIRIAKARRERARYAADPILRATKTKQAIRYKAEARDAINLKERMRYERDRETINARRRARYQFRRKQTLWMRAYRAKQAEARAAA